MNNESFDALGRHEYPIGRVDPPSRCFQFLKGVAIFTNLLPLRQRWDRTPQGCGGRILSRIGKISIPFFDCNIKGKIAKAICIPSINAWALDLKDVSVSFYFSDTIFYELNHSNYLPPVHGDIVDGRLTYFDLAALEDIRYNVATFGTT